MLLLYISVNNQSALQVPDIIYRHIGINNSINKRCIIYETSGGNKLFVFTHITYNNIISIDNLVILPMSDAHNAKFSYERRIPTCRWEDFCSPYMCNPSDVYDVSVVTKVFSAPCIEYDTMISIYTPSGLTSDDIISKTKYVAKERLDMRTYNLIDSIYPYIPATASTISEIRELSYNTTSTALAKVRESSLDAAALVLLEYLQYRVVCSSVENKTIYIFTDMWHIDMGHAYLNRVMMYEIPKHVCETVSSINGSMDAGDMLYYFSMCRENVIMRLCYLSESKSFASMLDDKVNIIATSDGVYDLINDNFRKSKASDYISICTSTPFLYPNVDQGINMLNNILSTFFPDPNILDFFLTTVALSLGGRNFEKIVVIWIGKTDSGKSTCQEFVEYVLGEYCGSLPSSMLVGKRNNPHGTTSAISSIGKKRLVFIQEPEEAKINSSQLKSLSGNDSIYSREIYEKGSSTKIKAICTIVTNGRMDFSGCDQAALSRIVVVPFTSTFVTSRQRHRYKTSNNIVDADVKISEKLKHLASPMLHILVDKYRQYLSHGYIIPDVIREHIDDFISNSNPAIYYMTNYLCSSPNAKVQISMLFSCFSSWYRNAYPSNKLIPLYQFRETIKSSGYDIDGEHLIGYAFNT